MRLVSRLCCPVLLAADTDSRRLSEALLKARVDGFNLLLAAAAAGNNTLLHALFEHEPNVDDAYKNSRDPNGRTALDLAVKGNSAANSHRESFIVLLKNTPLVTDTRILSDDFRELCTCSIRAHSCDCYVIAMGILYMPDPSPLM